MSGRRFHETRTKPMLRAKPKATGPLCTGVEHGPPSNPWSRQCLATASYRVVDDDLEGFLCERHAKLVKDMYEPGQMTRLRSAS